MLLILSADEILKQGLTEVGFDKKWQRITRAANLERFGYFYGSLPIVLAQVWEDLQTTQNPDALVSGTESNLKYFFLACHLLKGYKLEAKLAGVFKISERTVRDKGWEFIRKIQALKLEKVCLSLVF